MGAYMIKEYAIAIRHGESDRWGMVMSKSSADTLVDEGWVEFIETTFLDGSTVHRYCWIKERSRNDLN